MSPVQLRNLAFQRNQPEDIEGLSRTRITGGGHLINNGGWQDIEGNHTHSSIHIPIQQKTQTRGLEGYGSSASEDLSQRDRLQGPYVNHQRSESYQAVQTPGGKGNQDKGESSYYPRYRRTADPDRAYSDSFRLTRSRPNKLSSGFKPFRNQKITGQESPFSTIPGSFQEKTRKQGKEQYLLQQEEERVRPYDPEAVEFGERSAQEAEVVLNNLRISSPINKNITTTQIEHNVVTPESNLNQAVETPGGEGKQDKGESTHHSSYSRTADPDRAYSDSFRLTRSRPNQHSIGFTPFRNQKISG
ncbi:hypothetical protein O181_048061 [Austropuccinia psidii MF-1]|uniref:Uncharacterized protein n=1 Tax=Austropuccinia psidii MF-1 TaxID=1389203 RepID=A0A9Q3HK18_9BASI|nr:hypothetical protein [Austropuccinia psidii MF-1]